MIWIVGEYADRIDNADELLESFLDNFVDENAQVQLSLLTATVKLFLKKPTGTQELVQKVLTLATQECDNPDLRDRGFIYWRLLLTDPAAAKAVVLAEKPLISEETDLLEPSLLDELICHIASLASIYHKPPSTFVDSAAGHRPLAGAEHTDEVDIMGEGQSDLLGGSMASGGGGGGVDLLGGALGGLGLDIGGPATGSFVRAPATWMDSTAGKGLMISGTCARRNGTVFMDLTLANQTPEPMAGIAFQFNKNSFALVAGGESRNPCACVCLLALALGKWCTRSPERLPVLLHVTRLLSFPVVCVCVCGASACCRRNVFAGRIAQPLTVVCV